MVNAVNSLTQNLRALIIRLSAAKDRFRNWQPALILARGNGSSMPYTCRSRYRLGSAQLAPRSFHRPLCDPRPDLRLRLHGSKRAARNVPIADIWRTSLTTTVEPRNHRANVAAPAIA